MDSISKSKRYKGIQTAVSDKRYIKIMYCKTFPRIIDRDTINCGVILTSNGKDVQVQTNLHSGDYMQDVNEYFKKK